MDNLVRTNLTAWILLESPGISSMSITADVSKVEDVRQMVEAVVGRWGALHVACNNAGINMNSASEETTLEEWDKTFDVNLRGTFMCCQVCACTCVFFVVVFFLTEILCF